MGQTSRKKELETTIILSVIFLLLTAFNYYKTSELNYILIVITGVMMCSIVISPLGSIITSLWGKFSSVIGWVNSRIILSVIFVFVLTPIAILYRLVGKKEKTGFVERNYLFKKSDLSKPW